ncbi:histidine--tRNA ligase [Candidatus Woesearchaeota archaeon CG_4_10_14_0_2_um_filter_57_5]|nr:MAG: histidine--tRNA ligase [Candidatus Woesearchaeota archaeon CG1_02_57_44]PIZ55807.1 MAG: histidine--tRNA ligase [Candidatus Woesearchaeota archaeon CG_4_10_14_0_2_um_filter_57_5]
MQLLNAPGTRDCLPDEAIARKRILDTIKATFERYGYSPLETPAIERFDVLSSKYAGGDEILKETFRVHDQGQRELGLRYDLTVPFARVVGMNPQLKMPFKRYQVDKVWRDGPISKARYREFWQADVDIVGCAAMTADAELLMLAVDVFTKLGLVPVIRVNNRKILEGLAQLEGLEDKKDAVIIALDKLDKLKREDVLEELAGITGKDKAESILGRFTVQGTNEQILDALPQDNELLQQGISELREVLAYCAGADNNDKQSIINTQSTKDKHLANNKHLANPIVIDTTLARGLSYYTGTIFEIILPGSEVKSSVGGGGRYDKMIQDFLGGNQQFPAVGISFGVDRIYDAMGGADKKTTAKAYIIHFKNPQAGFDLAKQLRAAMINTDLDLVGRGPSKCLQYAQSQGIPFVLFLGEEELAQKKVRIKDMTSGTEDTVGVADAIARIIGSQD